MKNTFFLEVSCKIDGIVLSLPKTLKKPDYDQYNVASPSCRHHANRYDDEYDVYVQSKKSGVVAFAF